MPKSRVVGIVVAKPLDGSDKAEADAPTYGFWASSKARNVCMSPLM